MNKEFTEKLMGSARNDLEIAVSKGVDMADVRNELVGWLGEVFLGVILSDINRFSTPEGGMSYTLAVNDVIGALNTVLVEYKVLPIKLAEFPHNPVFSALDGMSKFDTIDDLVAQVEQDIKGPLH